MLTRLEPLETSIGTQIVELREENKQLKDEIKHLYSLMDTLENKSRKNNLLFGGITINNNKNYMETVEHFLESVLKVERVPLISRAYPVGRRDAPKKMIVAEFVRAEDVYQILSKTRVLKDTGFYVTRDLSKKARERKSKLASVKRAVTQKYPRARTSWKGNALEVEGSLYLWDDDRGFITNDGEDGMDHLRRAHTMEVSLRPEQIGHQQLTSQPTS